MDSTAVVPHLIGSRYVLQEKLGAGGMGAVFRAADRLTGQAVALKQLPPHYPLSDPDADLPQRLALSHEFQTLASLRHPNIITVLDYGFDEDQRPYFTMSLLETAQPLRQAGRSQPFTVKIN